MTTDMVDRIKEVAETRTIRIRLRVDDVERLRNIAHAERRPPADQAAWFIEQALEQYERSEDCEER